MFHVMNNGASGYTLKNADSEEIVEGIRQVAAGKQFNILSTFPMNNLLKKIAMMLSLITVSPSGFSQNGMYQPQIIPEPVSLALSDEAPFIVTCKTAFYATSEEARNVADYLRQYLYKYYGLSLQLYDATTGSAGIMFTITSASEKPEGAYRIEVRPEQILLEGANPQGLFYAVQTLIQLLPVTPYTGGQTRSELPVPSLLIDDYPRFAYRGLHLDVVRHIFPVEYIKRYIDFIALHKMNYFHWHLTDDQGWRMESKTHPALNERGAYRDGTIIGMFPGTGIDSARYGGYYTIEDMKEVVEYAAQRHITVVPEIDIPGHSMAILACYPHFGTEPDVPKKPAITWGIYNRENNILIPSEEVFSFLKDVFGELMEVFPSPYIHLGGDECSKKWWKESSFCQEFIKTRGLKNEEELQAYFVRYVSDFIVSKGRTPVGWNEIMQGGASKDAVVMSWQTAKAGVEAAKRGNKTIMTPIDYCYMNISQLKDEKTVLAHEGYTPIEKVYSFDPTPADCPAEVEANIFGGQICMWTEYYSSVEHLEYAIFPRLGAAAEVFWSPKSKRNLTLFLEKLEQQKKRYKLWGINYCDVSE